MGAIIEARNLAKEYRLGAGSLELESFREILVDALKRPFQGLQRNGKPRESDELKTLWALRGVSFDVAESDVVGILGVNGAGKSTLLKILSRVTDPTEGYVRVRGRMSSLLEVGTGFHPELTGRENVYLNGAILGMHKAEIDEKFDEIVSFAEMGRFLDTPVKRYSSGMYVRLAFSVAAHLNPEILIVDEVLAVGDIAFQKKCLGKMNEVSQEAGRTVLFVSHNMAAVENLCRRGMVLQQGYLAFEGTAREAIDFYLNSISSKDRRGDSHIIDLAKAPGRGRQYHPLLKRLELYTAGGEPLVGSIPIGAPVKIRVTFLLENPSQSFDVLLGFDSLLGQRIFTASSLYEPRRSHEPCEGERVFECEIPSLALAPGEYRLLVSFYIGKTRVDQIEDATRLTILGSDYYGTGQVPKEGLCVMPHRWTLD